jgi:hypothetical protein
VRLYTTTCFTLLLMFFLLAPSPSRASWDVPTKIPKTDSQTFGAKADVDKNGNAVVIWRRHGSLWARHYSPPTGWNEPELIMQTGLYSWHSEPQMDAAGNIHVLVQEGYDAFALRYTPAGGWGEAVSLEQLKEDCSAGELYVSDNGNAMAVWTQWTGTSHPRPYASRYTPATGWGEPVLIDNQPLAGGYATGEVKVVMNSSGRALAVWRQFSANDGPRVWINWYTPGSGWGTAELISVSGFDGRSEATRVALDDAGCAVVAWSVIYSTLAKHGGIWSSRFEPGGGWSAPEQISDRRGVGDLTHPIRLVMEPDGAILAVFAGKVIYDSYLGKGYMDLWYNQYVPDAGWGTPTAGVIQKVPACDSCDVENHDIAVEASGNVLLVWEQEGPGYTKLYSNRYRPGAGWETAREFAMDASNMPLFPDLAGNSTGHGFAVWEESGNGWDVMGAFYTPTDGAPDCTATYSASSGQAYIPCLEIPQTGAVYRAWMSRREGLDFRLGNYRQITAATNAVKALFPDPLAGAEEYVHLSPRECLASYEGATGAVHIPCLEVSRSGALFDVRMERLKGRTYRITDYAPK